MDGDFEGKTQAGKEGIHAMVVVSFSSQLIIKT
jgi:hypothetical protein